MRVWGQSHHAGGKCACGLHRNTRKNTKQNSSSLLPVCWSMEKFTYDWGMHPCSSIGFAPDVLVCTPEQNIILEHFFCNAAIILNTLLLIFGLSLNVSLLRLLSLQNEWVRKGLHPTWYRTGRNGSCKFKWRKYWKQFLSAFRSKLDYHLC